MLISYKIIGDNLRQARKQKNLTQEKIAELIGISTLHYGKIERSQRTPSLEFLAKAASVLDMQVIDLLSNCCPHPALIPLPTNAYTKDFINMIEKSSEGMRRLMYSICWMIAADFHIQ